MIGLGDQVSCLVDSVKAQDIKFYGEKKEKSLDFNAVAGTIPSVAKLGIIIPSTRLNDHLDGIFCRTYYSYLIVVPSAILVSS